MAKLDENDIWEPTEELEAVGRAVKRIFEAAKDLTLAADLASEGIPIDRYINGALRLRDLASFLSPNKPDWPTDGAKIYDLKTKKQMN